MESKIKIWLKAARLRTLPLAFATIFLGSMLAMFLGKFNWNLSLLAFLTTLFLQVLSNFANDYGDTQHGADHQDRKGPKRAVQQGLITAKEMYNAMWIFGVLSALSGLLLIHLSFPFLSWSYGIFVCLLSIAVWASITYTSGKNPYGYQAFGDLSVFIFFGVFGVALSAFIHLNYWDWSLLLPASAVGLLSTAVLNLNNMRDADSDAQAGKNTLAIILGKRNAKYYQLFLLFSPYLLTTTFVFAFTTNSWTSWLFLLTLPLIFKQAKEIVIIQELSAYDKWLKPTAITTLIFCILLGVGLNIAL
ncbi:MAG: 1,4-dihydroxy-2-naphthoate octaprenyltransferase [Flavobacteriales bacterium]|jgi:1,4-dihydroxy-2-naphthoate octaprenyltransferase|nr:1,4-dihydroxy-2-naphthoate octaprenyltransferase [Flavobacteriales bacterium]